MKPTRQAAERLQWRVGVYMGVLIMTQPGAWHLPLIAVGVGFHLAVGWALLWRYFQARERALLTWGMAWLIMASHVLGMFLGRMGYATSAPLVRDLSFAAAAVAFFVGQMELEGRSFRMLGPAVAGTSVVASVGLAIGTVLGYPVTMAAVFLIVLCLGGAAWLAVPLGTGRGQVVRWLLFFGYGVGILHAVGYLLPLPLIVSELLEMASHALFSLLFSAAVTWQAWEHERAVRLFSRTLERLSRPLSTQEALNEALDLVAETLRVTTGWIILRSGGRGDAFGKWTIAAALGFPEWAQHGLHGPDFPIDTCKCLAPVPKEALVSSIGDLPCARLTEEKGHPAGRHITIPLGADGGVQGFMVLLVPANRFFAPADVELLTAMGEQIGLALDRARLYDELRSKEEARGRLLAQLITAQEDERRRIARELHDETGQALTALVVNLDFLVRHPVEPGVLQNRLIGVREMAESTLAEVRRVIHEMRPTVLDDLGLEAAVRWLIKRYEEPSGLRMSVEFKGLNGRLPGHIEITVFRLIQEACTNVLKHAAAKAVQIRVTRRGGRLTVEVSDDGRGIDPGRQGSGMGLAGLRERVTLVGGALTVESAPSSGTRVYAELPLGGADHEDPRADLRRPHDGAAGRPHGAAVGAGH